MISVILMALSSCGISSKFNRPKYLKLDKIESELNCEKVELQSEAIVNQTTEIDEPTCDTIKLKSGRVIVAAIGKVSYDKVIYVKCNDPYLGKFEENRGDIDTIIWEYGSLNHELDNMTNEEKKTYKLAQYDRYARNFFIGGVLTTTGGVLYGMAYYLKNTLKLLPSDNALVESIFYGASIVVIGVALIVLGVIFKKKAKKLKNGTH